MANTDATNNTQLLLIIGATGPTGIEICKQAVQAGMKVRVLVRTPSRLPDELRSSLEVIKGDVLDSQVLAESMRGVSAVVSALGTPLQRAPVTLLSCGSQNIMQAMRQARVHRLLCITGMGAGDSRGHGGFLYDRVILPLLLKQIYLDKDRQEQLVRESELDWTLIRPAFLTNGAQTGQYRCLTRFEPRDRMGKISRADVAHYVVRELSRGEHTKMAVNLTY